MENCIHMIENENPAHYDYSGCFKYYLNHWGYGRNNTWPRPENMRVFS